MQGFSSLLLQPGVHDRSQTGRCSACHLLAKDSGDANSIPAAIQLTTGRTGQEYNHRKGRKGAFWEDRYWSDLHR